ncbi:MAG: ABC transporter ATP-binding protein [Lachnospiraceae bacterium]|nr:ABC transporter ATP-binding protein [Lachnospiraceae bacterium]
MSEGLICNNISKKYKDKEVLHGINLTLERGKIYGMIGRNGAGKTTLLSIMSAQNPQTVGTVTLDGETVWENRKILDHICFSREIIPSAGSGTLGAMKIKDYLKAAEIYYPNWDKELADKLMQEFQLNKKDKLGKISKGMLSMVTIIVALASKAEFTFLDEPTSGLDVVMREYFYRLLLEEYEKTNRTFLISTHIIEEAANIFEETLIIRNGELLLKENTQDLVERAFHISGKAEDVDAATEGLTRHHEEIIGRGKSVTVLLEAGESIREGYDVMIQPVSLQNLFVALCGIGEA